MPSKSSGLHLFTTTLAENLGWTTSLVPDSQQAALKVSAPDALLSDALDDEETPAALLTMPSGTQLMVVPVFDPGVYAIGPRLPHGLATDAVLAPSPHTPQARTMLADIDEPDLTADRVQHFAHEWEDHVFLLRNPHEPERRDRAFTAYTETLADALPGDWTTAPMQLIPSERSLLHATLWTSGPITAQMLSLRAARGVLLTGPDHHVVLLQEAGSRALITAATLRPPSLDIIPDDPTPGPAPLVLPTDPTAAADRIRSSLLLVWDRTIWNNRIGLLAHATVELDQTIASWHTVVHTYTGHPVADAAHDTAVSRRDAAARNAVDVYLAHAPALLDGITAVTASIDHVTGQLRDDLRELDNVRKHLTGLSRIRQALTELRQAPIGNRPFLTRKHAHEAWHHTAGLAASGAAMTRAARYVTHRIGNPPPPVKTPTPHPAPADTPAPVPIVGPTRRGR